MKKIIFGLILVTFFSCSSVKQMQVFVPKPTLVKLPSNIKRIAIVDKTQGNFLTAIEGVFSGEMVGIDKILVQECMAGLKSPFLNNSDLQITQHAVRLKSENMTSTGFGKVMNWDQVGQIAKLNTADALLVLEYYDSDFRIRNRTSPNNVGTILFQGFARAKVGIRIYDPKTKSIIYENSFTKARNYGETAASSQMLFGKQLFGTDAMKTVSYELGDMIGKRFVSYKTWEDRVIMKGTTDATKRAICLILAQDYNNAIITLEDAFKSEKKNKNKAKIAHNLGYCYEINGDLDASKKWLTESFTSSGNKKTQNYLDIINRRMVELKVIEAQNNQ